MPAPGSEVVEKQSPPSRSQPIQSGSWFIAGLAEKGSNTESVKCRNLAQFSESFGEFVSYGSLYNAADVFFREGGSVLNVTRVVGPAAVKATVTMKNGAAENTLKVTATSAGEWGNALKFKVTVTGGEFTYQVLKGAVIVETSPLLASNEAAVAWAKVNSKLVRLEDLTKGNPVNAESALATGADDKASILDAHWETAINTAFPRAMGPGQISMPGRTTEAAYKAQLNHAFERNRIALLDSADTPTKATHITNAQIGTALGAAGGKGGMFTNWHVVPGLTSGTLRTVPPSCIQAGILGRLASEGFSANKPGAGEKYGRSRYAVELTQPAWTEKEREELNNAGANVSIMKEGIAQFMGYRTMVNPSVSQTWLLLSNARLYMEISAKANVIAERYVFEEIDGKKLVFAKLNGELVGMLQPYFPGSLYGATFEEAVLVNTGEQVNTEQTIAERQINALIEVKMNPFGERVTIYVSKVATNEGL